MRKYLFPFLAIALMALTSCENETSYLLPTPPGEYFTFTVDGEQQTFSALSNEWNAVNRVAQFRNGRGDIELSRASDDGTVFMTLKASNIPLSETTKAGVATENFVVAQIEIYSRGQMSGSIYCPHPQNEDYVVLNGRIMLDELDADGTARGRFYSTGATGNAAPIKDGSFVVEASLDR